MPSESLVARYEPACWPEGPSCIYSGVASVIKTADGWKILDFKFSDSKHHSEAYEFQMKFYLYIAREIFSPLLVAELFYLTDGGSIKVIR